MSKTNDTSIEITVNFDRMPEDVGTFINGKRMLNPEDMAHILGYMSDRIDTDTDSLILCGYLPPFGWIQVGAELMNYPQMNVRYLAQNGFSCDLPSVDGAVI